MFQVVGIKPIPDSPVATPTKSVTAIDISDYYTVYNEYTNYEAAKASADFFNLSILSTQSKDDNSVFRYVVTNTESPLYYVRGVSNKESYGTTSSGYFGLYANLVPFEVAAAMCNYYNSRHPIKASDYKHNASGDLLETKAIKLVMFMAGEEIV